MRCFRSILNAIQSLNNKEHEETNSILKKKPPKAELGRLLLDKHRKAPDHYTKESIGRPRKDCYKELPCYPPNGYPCKSNCEQQIRMNADHDECDKRPTNRFNLARLLWIKNSFALDPFPDFKYNTVLVVNRGYKKLFKLVKMLILFRLSFLLTLSSWLWFATNNRSE